MKPIQDLLKTLFGTSTTNTTNVYHDLAKLVEGNANCDLHRIAQHLASNQSPIFKAAINQDGAAAMVGTVNDLGTASLYYKTGADSVIRLIIHPLCGADDAFEIRDPKIKALAIECLDQLSSIIEAKDACDMLKGVKPTELSPA